MNNEVDPAQIKPESKIKDGLHVLILEKFETMGMEAKAIYRLTTYERNCEGYEVHLLRLIFSKRHGKWYWRRGSSREHGVRWWYFMPSHEAKAVRKFEEIGNHGGSES